MYCFDYFDYFDFRVSIDIHETRDTKHEDFLYQQVNTSLNPLRLRVQRY